MREHNAGSYVKFISSIDKIIYDLKDIDEISKCKLKKIFKDIYGKGR